MEIAETDIISNRRHKRKITRSVFVPSSRESVTAGEHKCHGHHSQKRCVKRSAHWFDPLRALAASFTQSHAPPAGTHTVHYLEVNFSQSFKVSGYQTDLWSGSVRGSAGAVWTLWLKEKLSARGPWGTKEWRKHVTHLGKRPVRDDRSDSLRPEGAGSSLTTDDWRPTVVRFGSLESGE